MTTRTRVRSYDARHAPPAGLGPALKAARLRAGLSLRLTAYAAGITSSYVAALEAGRRCPSASVAEALAEVLHLDEGELAVLREATVDDAGRDHPLRRAATETST